MKELCQMLGLLTLQIHQGMVTEAVMRFGKWDKVIGLCNVPVGAMLDEQKQLVKHLESINL